MTTDRLPDDIERALGDVHAAACDNWSDEAGRCATVRSTLRRAILAGMMEARADGHDIGWRDALEETITGTENMAGDLRRRAAAIRRGE